MGGFQIRCTTKEHFLCERPDAGVDHVAFRWLLDIRFVYLPAEFSQLIHDVYEQSRRLTRLGSRTEPFPREEVSHINFGHDIWQGVIQFESMKNALSENLIDMPPISEEEISDRSKGDALSKGIAFLQLTWFIVQIIARAVQGLAITELELTTAALAGLNSVMYIFWWNKPLDVRCPVVIRTKGVEEILASNTQNVQYRFPEQKFSLRKQLRQAITCFILNTLTRIAEFLHLIPRLLSAISTVLVKSLNRLLLGTRRLWKRLRDFTRRASSTQNNDVIESVGRNVSLSLLLSHAAS